MYDQDPTHAEMMEALQPTIAMIGDGGEDDAEIAIYWFSAAWHGGQGTNLYGVLCSSPYSPGPISTFESEGDAVKMLYDELEQTFART